MAIADISQVVNVTVTLDTAPIPQAGFDTVMFLGEHRVFTERWKVYNNASDMINDGFTSEEQHDAEASELVLETRSYQLDSIISNYAQTLDETLKQEITDILTKTGIMVGLGEKRKEVIELIKDVAEAKCDFFTIGQYLQPHKSCLEVKEYIHPKVFQEYYEISKELGIKNVSSGPLVRSSYQAEDEYNKRIM